MNQRPKIDLYCLCWNEARIIPYFLRHYADLVDRFFIFDNHSTDGSVARLSGDPRVRLFQFDVTGDSFVEAERRLSDVMWKSSRGAADWVVMVDMDEHIHHPDLRAHLAMCRRDGVTAIQATGYEMIADAFPPADAMLSEAVTTGFRYAESLDKLCLFDPNAIEESHFRAGRHSAAPSGRIVWDETRSVKLLHYKQLGLDYFIKRTGELRTGLRKGDLRNGWGAHYARGPLSLSRDFLRHQSLARPVPGLAAPVARDVHLMVHGLRITGTLVEPNRLRFDLPLGATAVRIISEQSSFETPLLGVSVEGLVLHHRDGARDIPLDSEHLRDGWWGTARDDDRLTRWTDGNALVMMPRSIAGSCALEVRLTA